MNDNIREKSANLSAYIQIWEERCDEFNQPLANKLYVLTLNTFPEIANFPEKKRKLVRFRAFFRASELSEFMLMRIYDGIKDDGINTEGLKVPARDDVEGYKQILEKQLQKIAPYQYEELSKKLMQIQELNNYDRNFLYDCFDVAKKMLWKCFPEMIDFSGNSILRMNDWAYTRMMQFTLNVFSIIESEKNAENV